jgi:acyl-CoA dehydrogenase
MLKRKFTEEQQMFREAYRKFLHDEIVPNMEQWRENRIVGREAFTKAGELGFLMIWPDEEFGGMGDKDFRYEQIIVEENCNAMTSDWYCSLHSRLVGPYLTRFGNYEQQKRFLPKCVSGETILAIAMTEPDAGSDLRGMRTTAVDCGDHFLLNGSKTYISNGINADVIIVAAKSDPENNPRQIGLFIVERGMEGFKRGRNLVKMGQKAQDTAELFFDNVKIPKENVLGDPAKGMHYLMEGLAEERLIGMCEYQARAQKAIDLAVDFVKQRKVFGQHLSEFQNTQFKLAKMQAEVDAMQIYLDQCVTSFNAGEFDGVDAAKGKYLTSELACRVIDDCLQLHGGAGYMDEYPISRLYTDIRVARIYAGSSEVMQLIIARDMLNGERVDFVDRNIGIESA